ncbi:MAG: signal peptidase II [Caldimicrobium sp.]|nr:signal peptidase II [Caldimicrobium sp.]MCX7873178.1 signal peptidase II [Caldimicrobium sp.]MDW8094243.1 signal peptidase II [Caldimicrobium sp.]
MGLFYLSGLLVLLLDRITKYLILKINYDHIELTFFLNLVKVWNKGIAFGLFRDFSNFLNIFLILFTPLILIMILIFARKQPRFEQILLGCIFGGGMGNWLDRVLFGAVLDFIDFHVGKYHWPAFNIADLAISISLIIFLVRCYVFKDFRK